MEMDCPGDAGCLSKCSRSAEIRRNFSYDIGVHVASFFSLRHGSLARWSAATRFRSVDQWAGGVGDSSLHVSNFSNHRGQEAACPLLGLFASIAYSDRVLFFRAL